MSVIYHLGKLAKQEVLDEEKRLVTFSPVLRERLGIIFMVTSGHCASKTFGRKRTFERPLHIISANLHSVMNSLYGPKALASQMEKRSRMEVFAELSNDSGKKTDLVKNMRSLME